MKRVTKLILFEGCAIVISISSAFGSWGQHHNAAYVVAAAGFAFAFGSVAVLIMEYLR